MNLARVFFAPNYSEMFSLFVEASQSYRFRLDINPNTLVMRIISKYHEEYNKLDICKPDKFGRLQGDFNLTLMLKEAEIFCKNLKLLQMFENPNSFLSPSKSINWIDSNIENQDNSIFAECTSTNVLNIHNSDAFQTAGGSQTFESEENTNVFLSLNPYHGILIVVPMWLTHESYNNNFAGVKLSGGEQNFSKSGEPVLKAIKTGSHNFLEVIEKYGLQVNKISLSKGIEILKDYKF